MNKLLLVSTVPQDYALLKHTLDVDHWTVLRVGSCQHASVAVREHRPAVVVGQSSLPDGTWRLLLRDIFQGDVRARLIVISQVVDETLWAEVLNLGGYDVLPRPLNSSEVSRVVGMALRDQIHNASRSQAKANAAARFSAAAVGRVSRAAAGQQTGGL